MVMTRDGRWSVARVTRRHVRMTEADVMTAVTDLATILGWQHVHFRPARTAHGWRTPVSGPLGAGWPDLFLARPRDGRLLALEVKGPAGRVSPAQAEVHAILRASGLPVHVIGPDDLDTLAEVLR